VLLLKRIKALEGRLPPRNAGVPEAIDPDELDRFRSNLCVLDYETWRHAGLSLEHRLVLARDDDSYERANPRTKWSPGLCTDGQGRWVPRRPAISAREFEIRILERDGIIDERTVRSLRDNLHAHFFEGTENLRSLPHPIEFDETASLRGARAICPRRETLLLEQQLKMLTEDHQHDVQDRANRRKARSPTNGQFDSLDLFQDRVHEVLVKDLENRIRE
jgi:hypothetical protein